MRNRSFFERVRRLEAADILLLGEALIVLASASFAIKLLPFRRVAAVAATWGKGMRHVDERQLKKVRWAVDVWAQRVPWRVVCFQRGLATHLMLRRRGAPSILHYGVGRPEAQKLAAHVWVCIGGQAIVGGEEAPKFACVATFPDARTSGL